MSIKAVFRVQCDGPCKGWLSRTEDYVLGTEVLPEHNEVLPTAERAWMWPGERAARIAAVSAGWRFSHDRSIPPPYKIYCPNCKENPLGVQLPPDRGKVAALIRAQKEPSYVSGRICVDPGCPAGRAHYGPCPGPHSEGDE